MHLYILFQLKSLINFFSNIYIVFLLFIFGSYDLTSESFILLSLINIFTYGFSANIRNIYLGSKNFRNLNKIILLRIYISIIFGPFIILLSYVFLNKSFILFHSSLIFLTLTNWILELFLSDHEKKNLFKKYYFINVLFFLIFSLFLVYLNNILLLSILIFCTSIFNLIIFRNYFRNILEQNLIFKNFNINLGVFSTLFKTISNFFWRYFLIKFVGKSDASFLFIGFMFGSFYGTLFDISYGALFLKKIKKKNLLLFFLYFIYAILVFLIIYFAHILSLFEIHQFNILLNTVIFSLVGGLFLIITLQDRQSLFDKSKSIVLCYKADILIGSINFLIIPIIYYANKQLLVTSFFFSSIISYFIYKFYLYYAHNKKI